MSVPIVLGLEDKTRVDPGVVLSVEKSRWYQPEAGVPPRCSPSSFFGSRNNSDRVVRLRRERGSFLVQELWWSFIEYRGSLWRRKLYIHRSVIAVAGSPRSVYGWMETQDFRIHQGSSRRSNSPGSGRNSVWNCLFTSHPRLPWPQPCPPGPLACVLPAFIPRSIYSSFSCNTVYRIQLLLISFMRTKYGVEINIQINQ